MVLAHEKNIWCYMTENDFVLVATRKETTKDDPGIRKVMWNELYLERLFMNRSKCTQGTEHQDKHTTSSIHIKSV